IDRPLSDIERAVARRSLDYPHDEVGNNLDSIGLFQQRPTTGWGAPEKLIDPASATGMFYDKLLRIPDWSAGVPWQIAQKVQSSPSVNGAIYQASFARAVGVVDALWAEAGGPAA
ncbi:MAG TPA: peptidase M15, partial [Nakamurella sp.]